MIGLWAPLVLHTAQAAEPRVVTLEQALVLADGANPSNRIASFEARRARAARDQVAANYLPKINAEAVSLYWNEELLLDLGAGAGDGTPLPPPFDTLFEPSVIRERNTTNLSFTAVQPITGLYAVHEGHRATGHLARATVADGDATQARVRTDVVGAYFGTLETAGLAAVATQARESLEAHVERAAAFHRTGLMLKSDLLQLEVALSEARLAEGRARDGVTLSQRQLALLTGSDEPVAPAPIEPEGQPRVLLSVGEATAHALAHRPEARALEQRVLAARAGRRAARADLLPQVAGMATWQRTRGQGSFAAPEAWYVGLSAQWQLAGGGQKHFAIREASAGIYLAREGLRALEQGLSLEVEAALLEVGATGRAYAASSSTVAQAEENLRLVQARFDSQLVGANDLLDAETLAARARAERTSSWYDHLVAITNAQRSIGLPIDPLAGIGEAQ